MRSAPFEMPAECPRCRTPVAISGPFTVCPNRFGCPAQLERGLVHFASRGGLDIEGLGSETAALLVERGLVSELADLFDLTAEAFLPLDGFADKSAQKLADAIQHRRHTDLDRFLYGLGIPKSARPSRGASLVTSVASVASARRQRSSWRKWTGSVRRCRR